MQSWKSLRRMNALPTTRYNIYHHLQFCPFKQPQMSAKSSAIANIDRKIKIAIFGTGTIGPRHAQFISQNADTTLCAVVEPGDHGHITASKLGVPCYRSVEQLLKSYCYICVGNRRNDTKSLLESTDGNCTDLEHMR